LRKRAGSLKSQARSLGIDDAPFDFSKSKRTWLVGVIFRGNLWMEGVLVDTIQVDGMDVTDVIINMINNTKFASQIRAVFLDGITFGGFNIVDIQRLHVQTDLPIVTIVEKSPDLKRIRKSLTKFPDSDLRWNLISRLGEPKPVKIRGSKKCLFVQSVGLEEKELRAVLELTRKAATVPEALRAARMFASSLPMI